MQRSVHTVKVIKQMTKHYDTVTTIDSSNAWMTFKEERHQSHCDLIKKRIGQASKPFYNLVCFVHTVYSFNAV